MVDTTIRPVAEDKIPPGGEKPVPKKKPNQSFAALLGALLSAGGEKASSAKRDLTPSKGEDARQLGLGTGGKGETQGKNRFSEEPLMPAIGGPGEGLKKSGLSKSGASVPSKEGPSAKGAADKKPLQRGKTPAPWDRTAPGSTDPREGSKDSNKTLGQTLVGKALEEEMTSQKGQVHIGSSSRTPGPSSAGATKGADNLGASLLRIGGKAEGTPEAKGKKIRFSEAPDGKAKIKSRHEKRMAEAKKRGRHTGTEDARFREGLEFRLKAEASSEEGSFSGGSEETIELRFDSPSEFDSGPRGGRPSGVSTNGDRLWDTTGGLFNRLRYGGNERIVRSARILLRNQHSGEIRLILKPERLGEVRIRLEMKDKLIGGRIFVENDSVREAFQKNLPELSAAFQSSGFDVGSLEVSVGGGSGGEQGAETASGQIGSGKDSPSRGKAELHWEDTSDYYRSQAVNYLV